MFYFYNLLFTFDMLTSFHVNKRRSIASFAMTTLCGYTIYLINSYVAI